MSRMTNGRYRETATAVLGTEETSNFSEPDIQHSLTLSQSRD